MILNSLSGVQVRGHNVNPQAQTKRLLIVIQYYDGDIEAAIDQARLIADLERGRNQVADIMLFKRFDSVKTFNPAVVDNLKSKFNSVLEVKGLRRATGYPAGANEMFYEVAGLMSSRYGAPYWGWLNLESDCTPLRPTWIQEIIHAYKQETLTADQPIVLGHINEAPVPHINGVAVYPTNLLQLVGSNRLIGGPAQAAYDIYNTDVLLPVARDTNLIKLDFQKPTISYDDVIALEKNGESPALLHGVKDSSARDAIRAKYITLDTTGIKQSVLTFFKVCDGVDEKEQRRQLEVWKAAWAYRGFNPVVLGTLDCRKHGSYKTLTTAIRDLPEKDQASFLRWLAFGSVGGGLICDYDVLPTAFSTKDLAEHKQPEFLNALGSQENPLALAWADKFVISKFLKSTKDAVLTTDKAHFNTLTATWIGANYITAEAGTPENGKLVHYSDAITSKDRNYKSRIMSTSWEKY